MPSKTIFALMLIAPLLAGCGAREVAGLVRTDGSSTVYPITEAVAEAFQAEHRGQARVTVGVSGTGGGFRKFCRGEIDIANASRPIRAEEIAACRERGIEFIELPVAFDAITVAVHPNNRWAGEMTLAQLRAIWEPQAQGRIRRWNQVDPAWPDEPIRLFGAGPDSGTFDYFTEAVVGRAKASRGDYTASEDDHVLVAGVSRDRYALGYFGFAYYEENAARVKAVRVRADEASAAVAPSEASVLDGSYRPLARPMFIYVNAASAQQRSQVRQFVAYYLTRSAPLVREVRYVPLPPRAYALALQRFAARRSGTMFGGRSAVGERVEDLLARDAG